MRSIYCCTNDSLQLNKSFYLQRWIPNRTVIHRYQYSPTAKEIFTYQHPIYHRSFVNEENATSLTLLPATTELCHDIPSDAYPILRCPNNSFKVYGQHEPILANSAQIQDFSDYVKSMPAWIYSLIRNYTVYPSSHSLLYHIINKSQLLISTDGSRTHNKSGGSWIIALPDGSKLISGHNPEFGRHVDINSYHSEIYASLSSLTFLECFCDYFSLQLLNDIHATCDNKSYVTKMNEFITNPYTKLFIHKIKESEAYLAILSCLPPHFVITHVNGHQDQKKSFHDLSVAEKLNIEADAIATSCATKSLNTHLPSAPFALYVKGDYIHLPHHKRIREVSFEVDAKRFIKNKYGWNTLTIDNIDWALHSTQYNKLPSSHQRSVARFIHHRLPSGNMMFDYKHRCPFCKMSATSDTDHDHFLTCAHTLRLKDKRINSIFLKLEKLHTPPFLRDIIIHSIDKYYNNGLVDDIQVPCPNTSQKEINTCAHLQQRIGWGHFIRGRISTSFHNPINNYYRQNHLGKRYTSSFWFRSIINFL